MDPFILGHWFVGSAQLNKALIPTTWFGYMIFSHRIALKLKKDHNSTTFFFCFFFIGKAQFKYTCNVQENSKGKREIKGKGGKNKNKKTAQQSSLSSIGYPLTHLVKKKKKKNPNELLGYEVEENICEEGCASLSLWASSLERQHPYLFCSCYKLLSHTFLLLLPTNLSCHISQ